NRTLLHYYYRSKDKLFEAVFQSVVHKFFPKLEILMDSDKDFFEKIRLFIHGYMGILQENPFIPLFMLHEINNDPRRISEIIQSAGVNPAVFGMHIMQEVQEGKIKPIDPRQLITNMISLCVFPFVGAPLLNEILFMGDKHAYAEFIEKRKTEVAEFIIQSIKAE
ncbi:MAG: TetR/AcrR family transcriptional regulator, partial [Marinilabiliales bacterium]